MKTRTILVGIFFALVAAYTPASYSAWVAIQHMVVERGWNAAPSAPGGPELVVRVDANGPASDLQVGDEIIAINGQNVERSDYRMENLFRRLNPDDAYMLTIRREGALRDITLRRNRFPLLKWVFTSGIFATLLSSAVFLFIGIAVFAVKPDDKQALLLSLWLVLMASAFSLPQPFEGTAWWYRALIVFGQTTKLFAPTFLLHLFLIFPEPSPILKRWPRLERYLYLPVLLLLAPPLVYSLILWAVAPEESIAFMLRHPWIGIMGAVFLPGTILLALLTLVLSYRRAGQVSKRKLRLVVVGSLVAFVPFITWLFILGLVPRAREGWVPYAGWVIVNLLMLAMPISFAYAIVRHQVIPVKLIIRRGLQYLLAKNALRLIIALPVAALAYSIIFDHRTPSEILFRNSIFFYLLVVLAAALSLVFRRRLGEWVDRKFFRETYNQEKILRELTDDVKKLDSIPEMSRRVTERVTAALHPEQAFLFYREEGTRDLSLTYTSGGAPPQELKIPEEFRLLRFMEDQGSAQEFPFPQKNNLPQSEKTWLASLGTRLIVPLTGTDARLAGLLLLGEKKSEVPYTTNDRELLERLAGQIAIVYENVRLKNRVDRDRKIKHEVLARVAGQDMNVLKECPRCGACFDMKALVCTEDGTELTLSLPVERTIETRYRLERLIGKGGMGAVYEATDLRLHRKVAVKILTGSMFGNSDALRRFEREAQASARLHHPNIVTVHDFGLLSTEGAYLVMELLAGETLGAVLKRERQLAPADAASLFDQILDGLKSAHAAGVVHRDLKPENVLLSTYETGQARVHLLDFGLAKLTQALPTDSHSPTAAAPVTTPGAIMGTFGYMSPEQLTGAAVDERSDLFSIGVMVVEAVTGRRPFTGTTYHELLTNILNAPYHLEGASPAARELDAVLQKSLAKDPSARYPSAAAMQQELIPALRRCPPLVSPDEPAALDAETFILKS
ncbi:MAG TPA: protein kinase [Pyrinomonadaceae bacterium]|nr:protein kinase [Pyrinomonadaceae bacterium]